MLHTELSSLSSFSPSPEQLLFFGSCRERSLLPAQFEGIRLSPLLSHRTKIVVLLLFYYFSFHVKPHFCSYSFHFFYFLTIRQDAVSHRTSRLILHPTCIADHRCQSQDLQPYLKALYLICFAAWLQVRVPGSAAIHDRELEDGELHYNRYAHTNACESMRACLCVWECLFLYECRDRMRVCVRVCVFVYKCGDHVCERAHVLAWSYTFLSFHCSFCASFCCTDHSNCIFRAVLCTTCSTEKRASYFQAKESWSIATKWHAPLVACMDGFTAPKPNNADPLPQSGMHL